MFIPWLSHFLWQERAEKHILISSHFLSSSLSSLNSWAFLVPSWKRIWIFVLALETSTSIETCIAGRTWCWMLCAWSQVRLESSQHGQILGFLKSWFFLAKLCTDKVACQKQVAGTTLLQQSVDKRRFTLTIPNRKRSQEFSNVESFNMILYDSYDSVGLHDSRRLYSWSTSALRFGSKSLRNLHPHSPVVYSLQQDAQFSWDSHGVHMRFHMFSCLSLSVHWSYLKTIENLFDLIRFWVLSLLRLCP